MAGSLYLGSQRVCPAIVSGGSEPTEHFTLKFPDNMVELLNNNIALETCPRVADMQTQEYVPVVLDFNNIKTFSGYLNYGDLSDIPLITKVENIEKIVGQGFADAFVDCVAVDGYKDITFENLEEVASNSMQFAYQNKTTKTFNNIYFKKLTKIGSSALSGFGNKGVDIYFNAVTSATFQGGHELYGIGIFGAGKTLHFPSNLSNVIPNQDGYPNFDGTNLTILYDLEPTE